MKYFGVGTKKTGTTTLGEYFSLLGLKHHYEGGVALTHSVLRGDFSKIQDRIASHDSFEDAPWFMIYEYLYENVPDAKFILTVRSSPEKWLQSTRNHVENYGRQYPFKQVYGFQSPDGHEQEYLAIYNEHNQSVEDFFSDKKDRFLKICFEEEGTKAKLLEFIGKSDLELADIWSNPGTGGFKSKRITTKTRAWFVYWTRVLLDKLNLPMR